MVALAVATVSSAALGQTLLQPGDEHPVALAANASLLVAVEPGDWVEVTAPATAAATFGLAYGNDARLDWIQWQPETASKFQVPNWTQAQYVAVKVKSAAIVSIRQSPRTAEPRLWFELDEQLAYWLFNGAPRPEESPLPVAELLAALDGLRRELPADEPATQHLLYALWLEESLRLRPLGSPFFVETATTEYPEGKLVSAPGTLQIPSGGEVNRLQVRGFGRTTLRVYEGRALARQLDFNAVAQGKPAWSEERQLRTLSRKSRPLRVEVKAGSVLLSAQAYEPREAYRTLFGGSARHREGHWRRARASRLEWVRLLAEAKSTEGDNDAPFDRFVTWLRSNQPKLSAQVRAWLSYEASLLAPEGEPAIEFGKLALHDSPSDYGRRAAALRLLDLNVTEAPPRNGLRPPTTAQLEAWANANTDSLGASRIAAGYHRAYRFRAVEAEPGAPTITRLQPLMEQGQCRELGEETTRWLVVPEEPAEFTVALPEELYALSNLVPRSPLPQPEGYVLVDEQPVALHSAAGIASRLALRQGKHRIARKPGSPEALLELTSAMSAPCALLHTKQTLSVLDPGKSRHFSLPAPGATTIARLRIETTAPQTQLTLTQGSRTTLLELLTPGAHETELLVPKESSLLTVVTSAPATLQVAMRRAEDPLLAPDRLLNLPAGTSPTLTPTAQRLAQRDAQVQQQLPRLAALSQSLRTEPDPSARAELSEQRATALVTLGYKELGRRDLLVQEPVEANRDVARVLGVHASVIAANLNSRLAPLPQPADSAALLKRRARLESEGPIGCSQDVTQDLVQRADAESLLAAYCAERVPLPAVAAELYESIGQRRNSGEATLRAATLYADAAIGSGQGPLGMRAALLATRATSQGQDASSVRSRLAPAIVFKSVPLLDHSLGYLPLLRSQSPERSPKEQLLEAVTAAIPGALLLESEETAELQWNEPRASTLALEYGCDAGRGEPCALEARIDGQVVTCSDTTPQRRCQLAVPAGRHRLEFGFRGLEPVGWLQLTAGVTSLRPALLTRWHLLNPREPAQLTLRGPTLLRLQFRIAAPAASKPPRLHVTGCNIPESLGTLTLPSTADPTVKSADRNSEAVSLPVTLELPIESAQPCTLSVETTEPNTLAYLSVARVQGLPRERDGAFRSPADSTSRAFSATKLVSHELPVSHLPTPPVPGEQNRMPLLLGGRARFVSESLQAITEQDGASATSAFRESYVETVVLAHRELVENQLWGSVQLGTRLRDGPLSEVARLALDLPARPFLPGVELDGTIIAQTLSAKTHQTASTTAKLSTRLPLTGNTFLVPTLGYSNTYLTQAPGTDDGLDGELYSSYLAAHPRYASGTAQLNTRPFIDAQSSFLLAARTLPTLDALDRLTGTARLLFLPRHEWPLLVSAEWATSLRLESALRDTFFIRHQFSTSFGFWTWLSPHNRLRVVAELDCFFDAPRSRLTSPVLAPLLGLELTTSGTRGLRDLAPSQVPFRTFQERGSAP